MYTHTGPRPFTINYMRREDGKYSRYTLAFLCYAQWVTRNKIKARSPKGTPAKKYSVWPVFQDAGRALKSA